MANLITSGQLHHSHKLLLRKLQASEISPLGTLIPQHWRSPSSSYTVMGPFCGAGTFPSVYTLDHAREGLVPRRVSLKVNHFVIPKYSVFKGLYLCTAVNF